MDLSSIIGGFAGMMPDDGTWAKIQQGTQGLTGLMGGLQSQNQNSQINNQVQTGLNTNANALQAQIDALNGQISQARQQAQDQYAQGQSSVAASNAALQGNIGTQTANLNALSDPNSPYMQQARQAIERKDAAAGRNSQWGDRETQLAGTLAQYVSQYSPAMQSSITQAQNQINLNNQGLASLYNTANQPANQDQLAQIQAIQQQIANVNAQNGNGRQAATAANNGTLGAINNGVKSAASLGSLFNGLFGNSNSNPGVSTIFQGNNTPSFGTDWGNNASVLGNGDVNYNGVQMPLTGDVQSQLGQNYGAGSNPYGFQSSMGGGSSVWDMLDNSPA